MATKSSETSRNADEGSKSPSLTLTTSPTVNRSGSTSRNEYNNNNNTNVQNQTSSRSGGQTSAVISTVLSNAPTSTLATTSVRVSAAGSRRVRQNWLSYIIENFRSASRTSKVLLILSLTMVLIQVVVTVAVLVTSRNMECDKPLRLFLELYIVRVLLACPVNVYLYLNPRENRLTNGQTQSENERRRDGWVDRLKSFLDLFATLWFIIGNYLLFTTNTCQTTAPSIFYLSLTWVILGYIIITIPILLCLAVIFCLPCVLVAMRVLHVSEAGGKSGASEDIIAKIPLVKFKSSDSTVSYDVIADTGKTNESLQSPPLPQKSSKYKFKFGKKEKQSIQTSPTVPQFLTIDNKEDAACCICLASYEDGEDLRHLWCSHHFHKECVDVWLRLNRQCPMCRVDVVEMASQKKGKNAGNENLDNGDNSAAGNSGEGSSGGTGGSQTADRFTQNADNQV
ncbi:hypothetical protein G9A89_019952 [Geosiphon pyriformis]|nr:hypothetical protein G9A89_019952 [Geosiphon pyriformis]